MTKPSVKASTALPKTRLATLASRIGMDAKRFARICAPSSTPASKEFAGKGIRVNAVAPGSIDTPLFENVVHGTPNTREDYEKRTPMKRIAKPEEVAASATWLCSDAAAYVTGAVLPVDGGMTL